VFINSAGAAKLAAKAASLAVQVDGAADINNT